jgi:hypothetical protein
MYTVFRWESHKEKDHKEGLDRWKVQPIPFLYVITTYAHSSYITSKNFNTVISDKAPVI